MWHRQGELRGREAAGECAGTRRCHPEGRSRRAEGQLCTEGGTSSTMGRGVRVDIGEPGSELVSIVSEYACLIGRRARDASSRTCPRLHVPLGEAEGLMDRKSLRRGPRSSLRIGSGFWTGERGQPGLGAVQTRRGHSGDGTWTTGEFVAGLHEALAANLNDRGHRRSHRSPRRRISGAGWAAGVTFRLRRTAWPTSPWRSDLDGLSHRPTVPTARGQRIRWRRPRRRSSSPRTNEKLGADRRGARPPGCVRGADSPNCRAGPRRAPASWGWVPRPTRTVAFSRARGQLARFLAPLPGKARDGEAAVAAYGACPGCSPGHALKPLRPPRRPRFSWQRRQKPERAARPSPGERRQRESRGWQPSPRCGRAAHPGSAIRRVPAPRTRPASGGRAPRRSARASRWSWRTRPSPWPPPPDPLTTRARSVPSAVTSGRRIRVPSRARWARRFFAILKVTPAARIRRLRSVASATVRPVLWVTTIIEVAASASCRPATNSRFSVRSTSRLHCGLDAFGLRRGRVALVRLSKSRNQSSDCSEDLSRLPRADLAVH